jgi:hypothetical protein
MKSPLGRIFCAFTQAQGRWVTNVYEFCTATCFIILLSPKEFSWLGMCPCRWINKMNTMVGSDMLILLLRGTVTSIIHLIVLSFQDIYFCTNGINVSPVQSWIVIRKPSNFDSNTTKLCAYWHRPTATWQPNTPTATYITVILNIAHSLQLFLTQCFRK